MLLEVGSTILSILDVLAFWFIARRYRWGWIFDVFVNTLWFPYDVITHQLGFFVLGFAYYYIAWDGWRHWHDTT